MKRLNNIDLLKFICAVLVVFLHMGTPYQQYILPLTRCAVPCFLIISGYFIFNADDAKFQARLKKNIRKIFSRTRLEYSPFRCGEIYVCVQTA